MRHLLTAVRRPFLQRRAIFQRANYKPQPPPPPPSPPRPPKKPESFCLHGDSWEDEYIWMSQLKDKVAMRHMDVYMEQEEKYTEAVMSDTERLQSKLQSEIASRLAADLSTPPVRWGPWLYYRRVEEGKQYPVLCRRLASLNEEFISNKSPAGGFDFTSGRKIEQVLIDYNQEAERFGGYAYEELSEVSPDHRHLAYTMYDKDNDYFKLSVRDLNFGSLCSKPQAERVSSMAWNKDGKALLYVVTNDKKKPFRLYCSILGSKNEDVLLLEEPHENVHINVRHTKDFHYLTVNVFSTQYSKVFLINAADPLSGMTLVWECEPNADCIIEHHQGYLYIFTNAAYQGQPVDHHYLLRCPVSSPCSPRNWENIFANDQQLIIEDVDFCNSHMLLVTRDDKKYGLYSISLPLSIDKAGAHLNEFDPESLPLPDHVSQILPGANYDFYSSTMRFTIISPVMPDAVVDYDLLKGKWTIVQQQNLFYERTRILYGSSSPLSSSQKLSTPGKFSDSNAGDDGTWNDLSEYYACEEYNVPSHDGVLVPLTIVYSRRRKTAGENPGLLHGHGAYGEILDKRWKNELKSLLDRGWIIAYADVRGGGGRGKMWHHGGRRTMKLNSVKDYISCAKFLTEKGVVQESKLAGWGYSAGGLLVASAINFCPDLFRAAILEVPFLDPTSTLLLPILPLTPEDYEEFGYPGDIEDFRAIREYSPYDNIRKHALYPAILVTSSFSTRFGVWESAKWVARVREYSIHDPMRPVLLSLTTDIIEENRYLQSKESALKTAFLIKTVDS
ncbi:prolyl oligopeptidase family protein [Striga asiatica]|uniref:Prolyl endopeptidase n=1 Tax=Striga asiatica TaxID=4170 RepID=A0A5A7PTU2_STRAF|nr:prolyl oligopeptidase family protein [Striga asiatica]